MQKNIVVIGALLVLSCNFKAFAETTLAAEVDKLKIAADETVTYKLNIDSTEKTVPRPRMPKFEGFNVLSQAESSTVSLASGGLKSRVTYVYILAPKAGGKLKIEPSEITIEAKTYASQGFEIEVTLGKNEPQTKPEEGQSLPEDTQENVEEPQVTL